MASQVSYSICKNNDSPPSDGTFCVYGSSVFDPACYTGDTPSGTSFKCPLSSGSKDDTQGQYCPSTKPKGASRCCIGLSNRACPGGHCVEYEQTCCGSGACDEGIECCDGECLKAGETCCGLLSSTQKICSTDEKCSNNSCINSLGSTTTSRRSTSTTSTTEPATQSTTPTSSPAPDDNMGNFGVVILAAAMPATAKRDPEVGCFLSPQYTSYYTTPEWYKPLPTMAQSVFSASQAGLSKSVCTSTTALKTDDDGEGTGSGIKIGIGAGIPIVAILLGLFLLWKLKPRIFGSKKQQNGNENVPVPETEAEKSTGSPFAYSAASELTASPALSKATPMTMNSSVVGGSPANTKSYYVGAGATGYLQTESERQNEFSQQQQPRSELHDNSPASFNSNTISRRPVQNQHDVEVGRSELAASPHSGAANLSPRIGAHELAGLERYEMDAGDPRHEAPGGIQK